MQLIGLHFFKIEKHGNFLFELILVIIGANLNFQRTWVTISCTLLLPLLVRVIISQTFSLPYTVKSFEIVFIRIIPCL